MTRVLGLDVSTSIVGYAVLDDEEIVCIGHIDFKGCEDFWEKVDHVHEKVNTLIDAYNPDKCFIEESLMGFSTGLSSAGTLFTLSKFNALVSYFVRQKMSQTPEYIAANAARRAVGIKLQQKKKCGLSHKEQAFEWATQGPLKNRDLPKTRGGKSFKPFVYDEVDGFIIALAGTKLNKSIA